MLARRFLLVSCAWVAASGLVLTGCASTTESAECSYPRSDATYLFYRGYATVEYTSASQSGVSFPEDLAVLPVYGGDFSDVSQIVILDFGPSRSDSNWSFDLKAFVDPSDLVKALCASYETESAPATLQLSFSHPLFALTEDGEWSQLVTPAETAGLWPAEAVDKAIEDSEYVVVGTGTVMEFTPKG